MFVHGWGSSYHAEQQMVNYAKSHGVTKTTARANVSRSGKVTWVGNSIEKNSKNPIIEVNLANNTSVSAKETNQAPALSKSSNYIKDVLSSLQKEYHVTKVNLVGHSMGNLQIAYYLLNNASNRRLPQVQKQISIAGHYNG
ncbi:MAG: alpha/beta hydrolase [Oenococcus oeni]